jgi:hypothetical protein
VACTTVACARSRVHDGDAYLAIRADDQLENRFAPHPAPLGTRRRRLLAAGQLRRVVPAAPALADREPGDGLLSAHPQRRHHRHELAHLLTDAAVAAIESGEEAINQRTLLMADYVGPTERRRLFERELA